MGEAALLKLSIVFQDLTMHTFRHGQIFTVSAASPVGSIQYGYCGSKSVYDGGLQIKTPMQFQSTQNYICLN